MVERATRKTAAGTARPTLRWGGPKGTVKPPVTQGQAIGRVVAAVAVLANPVAAVAAVAATVVLTRTGVMRRVRGWWVLGGAGVVTVGTLRWTYHRYLTPWVDLRDAVMGRAPGGGQRVSGAALGELAAARWPAWLVGQVPLALLLGVAAAGFVVVRRQRYGTRWRVEESATRAVWDGAKPVQARPETPYPRGTGLSAMSTRMGHSPIGSEVRIAATDLFRHAVTTGPTGYGKTTTLLRLMWAIVVQWRVAACPLVMFDFKADPAVRDSLREWAEATGRRFWFVSVTEAGGDTYDPMVTGTAEEVASRLVETIASAKDGGFSEPHHRSVGERWLIATMLVLDDLARGRVARADGAGGRVEWARSLADLAILMQAPVLNTERTHAQVGPKAKTRSRQMLDEIGDVPDLKKSVAGMRTRIALMAETAAGDVLVPRWDGVELEAAIRGGDVVLFSLSAATNAAAARVVGNLAIFDLGALFDRLQHESWAAKTGRRAFLVFDEFSGLGGEALRSLYERARSGGGALISSTQTGAGFLAVSEEFAASVWGNSNVWLLHHQDEGDVEDRSAAMGTERGWTETLQVHEDADVLGSTSGGTGVGSLRRTDHYRVHPNELRSLGIGQLVLYRKAVDQIDRVTVEEVAGASTGRILTQDHDQDDAPAEEPVGEGPADLPVAAAAAAARKPRATPGPRNRGPAQKSGAPPARTVTTTTSGTESANWAEVDDELTW